MNLGGSPILVLMRKSSDQNANLLGDLGSSAGWAGPPAPIETEAGAVPADHRVGFDEDQDVRPAGPTQSECCPEESVPGVQFRPRPFPFEHGDLLSEGEDFEGGIASTAQEDSDGDKKAEKGFEHERPFLTRGNVASPNRVAKSQVADFKPSSDFVYTQAVLDD
jgi:hypothetical protein